MPSYAELCRVMPGLVTIVVTSVDLDRILIREGILRRSRSISIARQVSVTGAISKISVQCACGKKLMAPITSAGRKAKCPGCGTTLEIPMPIEEPVAVRKSSSAAAPARPGPPPLPVNQAAGPPPAPVIPYQTPASYVPAIGMWREGELAVAALNVPFPMRCVKCNAQLTADEMKRKPMYWVNPGFYATLLLGLLLGAIIILCVRKKTDVTFGICRVHRAQRRNKILIGWLIAFAGIGSLALTIFLSNTSGLRNSPMIGPLVILGVCSIIRLDDLGGNRCFEHLSPQDQGLAGLVSPVRVKNFLRRCHPRKF